MYLTLFTGLSFITSSNITDYEDKRKGFLPYDYLFIQRYSVELFLGSICKFSDSFKSKFSVTSDYLYSTIPFPFKIDPLIISTTN